jgi:hypothetical protein
MQEIALVLSSIAGIATAVAVKRAPKDKNQLLSLGASSHIKNQINSLKIEKDILTKTISRLYQTEDEFSKIQKSKLLLKYQHQLGIILAKLEKLEQASKHPDLGPVGDGLISLMDQKLSKLDDRLYELSSKMSSGKIQTPKIKQEKEEIKQQISKSIKDTFNFEKPKETKIEPIVIPPTKSRQSFELTTLTNISRTEPKFPLFEKKETEEVIQPIPKPKIIQTELVKPKEEVIQPIPKPKIIQTELVKPKEEVIQPIPKPIVSFENKPDLQKEVAKITEHKALPEQKPEASAIDDDFDDGADELDKIKGDIMRVLSKLDQAEVE